MSRDMPRYEVITDMKTDDGIRRFRVHAEFDNLDDASYYAANMNGIDPGRVYYVRTVSEDEIDVPERCGQCGQVLPDQ